MQIFDVWKNVLVNPANSFAKYQRKANYTDALKHLVIGGVIAGFIDGLALLLVGAAASTKLGFLGAATGIGGFFTLLIGMPVLLIIGWIIASAIYYIFAVLLKGKGSFLTQSYDIALYTAPLAVIYAIFGLIPVIGSFINFLVFLYSLYLLTIALKAAHKYSTAKAFLTWFIPAIIIGIIVLLIAAAAIMAMISSGMPMAM